MPTTDDAIINVPAAINLPATDDGINLPTADDSRWSMLPPPTNRSFQDIQEAMDWMGDWAAVQGYAVSKKSSYTNKKGFIPTVWFRCQRSKPYNDRRTEKIRKTVHLATGCPFAGKLCRDPLTGRYTITIISYSHNHPGAPPSTWTAHRQREIRQNRPEIISLIQQDLPNRFILQSRRISTQPTDQPSCITKRDIDNMKQRWQVARLKSDTAI